MALYTVACLTDLNEDQLKQFQPKHNVFALQQVSTMQGIELDNVLAVIYLQTKKELPHNVINAMNNKRVSLVPYILVHSNNVTAKLQGWDHIFSYATSTHPTKITVEDTATKYIDSVDKASLLPTVLLRTWVSMYGRTQLNYLFHELYPQMIQEKNFAGYGDALRAVTEAKAANLDVNVAAPIKHVMENFDKWKPLNKKQAQHLQTVTFKGAEGDDFTVYMKKREEGKCPQIASFSTMEANNQYVYAAFMQYRLPTCFENVANDVYTELKK